MSWFLIHSLAFSALALSMTYIYLNETNKLAKIKKGLCNKVVEVKETIKNKM